MILMMLLLSLNLWTFCIIGIQRGIKTRGVLLSHSLRVITHMQPAEVARLVKLMVNYDRFHKCSLPDLIESALQESQIKAYVDNVLFHYEMALRFPNIPDLHKQVSTALQNYESYAYTMTELWSCIYQALPEHEKPLHEADDQKFTSFFYEFEQKYKFLGSIAETPANDLSGNPNHLIRSDRYEAHMHACLRILTKYLLQLKEALTNILHSSVTAPEAVLQNTHVSRPRVDSLHVRKILQHPGQLWGYHSTTKPK